MKTIGIVAEFNPFHNGHEYLIKKAKEITGADIAICIMSGNFTQAGNISIIDKFKRAKTAIENGFDAIIELPTIYATSSSQFFAYGAINILNSLNCIDYLCFGSESGNIKELITIANKLIVNDKLIWENISKELKTGISFAKARENAICPFLTNEEIQISITSNNILAIEYIKSLITLKSTITPIAIKREEKDNITSATKIRAMVQNNEDYTKYLPNNVILENTMFNNSLFTILKYKTVSLGKQKLAQISEVTEGLENKIYNEINYCTNYEDFIQNIKSKRYQLSKIKRIMINILLDITKDLYNKLNNNKTTYAHILALNENTKNKVLSLLGKNSNIPIITSINDEIIDNLNLNVKESLLLDIKSNNIYSVLSNNMINKDYTNKL